MPETNTPNKVQFNLKNAYYAKKTANGYATPVAIPGAVNLNLSAQGEVSPFYADGVVYYRSAKNNGYSGDFEIALVPLQMLKDIWGYTEDANKVLTESADKEDAEFALLFQIDGDQTDSKYVLYSVTATRPAIASQTNEGSKTPKTQSLSMTAIPAADSKVMSRTTQDTPTEVSENWFTEVYTGPAA